MHEACSSSEDLRITAKKLYIRAEIVKGESENNGPDDHDDAGTERVVGIRVYRGLGFRVRG